MSLRPPPASRGIGDGGTGRPPPTRLAQILRAASQHNATGVYDAAEWDALCRQRNLPYDACEAMKRRARAQEEFHEEGLEDEWAAEPPKNLYAQGEVEKPISSEQRTVNRFVEQLYIDQKSVFENMNTIANGLKTAHPNWGEAQFKADRKYLAGLLMKSKSLLENAFKSSFTIARRPASSPFEERMQAYDVERQRTFLQSQIDLAIKKIRLAQQDELMRIDEIAAELQAVDAISGNDKFYAYLGKQLAEIVLALKTPYDGYPVPRP